jgi:hypothetical protein
MRLRNNLKENYSLLYFLAALGNGGMAVGMFIYLMFMVPHPDTPIVTFNHLWPYLTGNNPFIAGLIGLAMVAMIFFAVRHFWLVAWNLQEYAQFRRTPAYEKLIKSNGEVSLMALPLTLAMSINVSFALGAVLVPNLWLIVEWLFLVPLIGFSLVGGLALKIYGTYLARILTSGGFDYRRNNNFSQMIAIFAFTMIAVGFAAPAAMSQNPLTAALGTIGSLFFLGIAALLGVVKLVLSVQAMFEHGIDTEGSASLWILIPILTLTGITLIRLSHGLHNHFELHVGPAFYFLLTTGLVALQLLVGGMGYMVMKRMGYYDQFIHGERSSAGSYSLICPGVALFVLGMFALHPGLVNTGVLTKFSVAYYLLLLPLVLVQLKTIQVMLKLDRKLLRPITIDQVATPQPTQA